MKRDGKIQKFSKFALWAAVAFIAIIVFPYAAEYGYSKTHYTLENYNE